MAFDKTKKLYYIHDPMCSWCWGFHKTWNIVEASLKGKVEVRYVVGGLAADSDEPMPEQMQAMLQNTWRTIQQRIPGTEFNFEFWNECTPRRSTYPACRAVLAAKKQGAEIDMIAAIQTAYYLGAKNPSDLSTLEALAESIEIEVSLFSKDIRSNEIQTALLGDISLGHDLGANGFPSLVLESDSNLVLLNLDYNSPQKILEQIV